MHPGHAEVAQTELEIIAGINRILQATVSAATEADLARACIDVALEITQSAYGFIAELGDDGLLHDIALSDMAWFACAMSDQAGHSHLPRKVRGLYGEVVTKASPLIVNHRTEHPASVALPEGHPPLESFLGVPLTEEGRVLGLIAVANRGGGYSDEQQEALMAVSPAIVQAFQRKRAELNLRSSEQKYRSLFDSIDQGFFVIDVIYDEQGEPADMLYVEANDAATRMLGTDFTGKRLREIDPAYEECWYEIFGRVAATGESVRTERYAETDKRWYSFYVFRLDGPGSRRIGNIFLDITERKRREDDAAFLVELADVLSHESDEPSLIAAVGESLGRYLEADNVLFARIDESLGTATVASAWSSGRIPDVSGVYEFSEYVDASFVESARGGMPLVVRDTEQDDRTNGERYGSLDIQAFVTVPYNRDGRWQYMLTVNQAEPREWSDADVALVEEVARTALPRLERAQAEKARSRELQTTRLMLETAKALSSSMQSDDVVLTLVDLIKRATGAGRVTVALYDSDTDEMVTTIATLGESFTPGTRVGVDVLAPQVRSVLTSGRAQAIDYESDRVAPHNRRRAALADYRYALVAPLVLKDKVIGILSADDPGRRREFSERDVEIVSGVASQAAVAIENAQLFAERSRQARYADALNRINDSAHSSLDFDDVIDRVLAEVAKAIDADGAAVHMRAGDHWQFSHQHNLPEGMRELELSDEQATMSNLVRMTHQPVMSNDVQHDERANVRLMQRFGIIALAGVPLVTRGEAVGVLFAGSYSGSPEFDEHKVDFLVKAAATLGLAMENARLYAVEREGRRLAEALSRIERAMHATLDQEEMLSAVIDEAAVALGADGAVFATVDHEGNWLVEHGYQGSRSFKGMRFTADDVPFAAGVLQSAHPVTIDDAFVDARARRERQESFGIRAVMAAPVVLRDRTTGVLFFNYDAVHHFSEQEVVFATRLGNSVGIAMQNIKLYEAERTIADRLQEALLALPDEVRGVEFAHAYHSATEDARVGGDFYDLFELNHDHVGLVVGDVAGKGLDAAVLTSMVKNTIRAHAAERGKTPGQILELTNEVVYKATTSEAFVTVFFGILDCRDGRIVYANAGHTTAAITRADGPTVHLPVTGPLVGALAEIHVDQGESVMDPHDVLFLYTDGLTEARRGKEFYGEGRLFEVLDRAHEGSAADVVREVLDEVLTFGGHSLKDDLAILAVKRVEHGALTPQQQKLEM